MNNLTDLTLSFFQLSSKRKKNDLSSPEPRYQNGLQIDVILSQTNPSAVVEIESK